MSRVSPMKVLMLRLVAVPRLVWGEERSPFLILLVPLEDDSFVVGAWMVVDLVAGVLDESLESALSSAGSTTVLSTAGGLMEGLLAEADGRKAASPCSTMVLSREDGLGASLFLFVGETSSVPAFCDVLVECSSGCDGSGAFPAVGSIFVFVFSSGISRH